MLIKYNVNGPWIFSLSQKQQGDLAKAGVNSKGHIRILPGVNKLEKAEWACMKDHPQVKILIEDDKLELLSEEEDEEKKDESGNDASLSALSEKEAIKVVKSTIVRELLQQWEESEGRPKVKAAIKAALKISAPSEKTEKGE